MRVSELDARSTAITILLVATFVVLEAARGYGGARTPLGDDASSHTATIATFAKLLMNGQGWWSTDYNLGFPLGLYYQPVPHVVSAAFCALLGGPEMAIFTYKFFSVAMIALQPWAVAFGLRRAGADRLTSAIAGALAPFVIHPEIGASMASATRSRPPSMWASTPRTGATSRSPSSSVNWSRSSTNEGASGPLHLPPPSPPAATCSMPSRWSLSWPSSRSSCPAAPPR
ncbi:MAG: hypothetical protein HQ461_09400 [Deltaproteobacteria bacterium]|nr:hypothetical protein [Deltaproteobacteria bacterium]